MPPAQSQSHTRSYVPMSNPQLDPALWQATEAPDNGASTLYPVDTNAQMPHPPPDPGLQPLYDSSYFVDPRQVSSFLGSHVEQGFERGQDWVADSYNFGTSLHAIEPKWHDVDPEELLTHNHCAGFPMHLEPSGTPAHVPFVEGNLTRTSRGKAHTNRRRAGTRGNKKRESRSSKPKRPSPSKKGATESSKDVAKPPVIHPPMSLNSRPEARPVTHEGIGWDWPERSPPNRLTVASSPNEVHATKTSYNEADILAKRAGWKSIFDQTPLYFGPTRQVHGLLMVDNVGSGPHQGPTFVKTEPVIEVMPHAHMADYARVWERITVYRRNYMAYQMSYTLKGIEAGKALALDLGDQFPRRVIGIFGNLAAVDAHDPTSEKELTMCNKTRATIGASRCMVKYMLPRVVERQSIKARDDFEARPGLELEGLVHNIEEDGNPSPGEVLWSRLVCREATQGNKIDDPRKEHFTLRAELWVNFEDGPGQYGCAMVAMACSERFCCRGRSPGWWGEVDKENFTQMCRAHGFEPQFEVMPEPKKGKKPRTAPQPPGPGGIGRRASGSRGSTASLGPSSRNQSQSCDSVDDNRHSTDGNERRPKKRTRVLRMPATSTTSLTRPLVADNGFLDHQLPTGHAFHQPENAVFGFHPGLDDSSFPHGSDQSINWQWNGLYQANYTSPFSSSGHGHPSSMDDNHTIDPYNLSSD